MSVKLVGILLIFDNELVFLEIFVSRHGLMDRKSVNQMAAQVTMSISKNKLSISYLFTKKVYSNHH